MKTQGVAEWSNSQLHLECMGDKPWTWQRRNGRCILSFHSHFPSSKFYSDYIVESFLQTVMSRKHRGKALIPVNRLCMYEHESDNEVWGLSDTLEIRERGLFLKVAWTDNVVGVVHSRDTCQLTRLDPAILLACSSTTSVDSRMRIISMSQIMVRILVIISPK